MIHNLSLTALAAAYRNGDITPLELVCALRAQALAQNDNNAWITLLTEDQLAKYAARLEGETPDSLPLFGVPFAIKDNIDLAGVPTTAACKAFTYTPDRTAYVVQQLLNAGAIPLGKTNLDQFATGLVGTRSPWGEVGNSFNSEYISGGSSAGSAVATALGQVSFALGTDTAGSGRVPAALNNLIGHKPSKGLLSNSGVVPACKSLDCVSIFALTADDASHVLQVAAVFDAADPYARTNAWHNHPRLAKSVESFTFGIPDLLDFDGNQETERLFGEAVAQLQTLGGTPIELDFSAFTDAAKLLYEGPWVVERQLATAGVATTDMLPVIAEILAKGSALNARECFSAQYRLAELKTVCDAQLAKVDFVLTPTSPSFYTRDQLREDPITLNSNMGRYTNFMNLLDYSATAVPIGFTECGVPWGITLFADKFCDHSLLKLAGRLQTAVALPLGATMLAQPTTTQAIQPAVSNTIDVVVCGAHLEGLPLNWQLTVRGATLKQRLKSAPSYRLYALPDGKRPAMMRDTVDGAAIEVEVWSVPSAAFGSFVAGIPAPLGIGKVELEDGSWVSGFVCDAWGLDNAKDVTEHGGWRNWLSASAQH